MRAVFEKKKLRLCSKITMKMNFDAPETAKNGKFRYFYIKKCFYSKRYLWFCIFAGSNCKFDPFSVKKKWKSSKCSKKKSWHFRKKRCMGLFLGISCRIHKKYQFWNLRPRVKSIIHFGMEWPHPYIKFIWQLIFDIQIY